MYVEPPTKLHCSLFLRGHLRHTFHTQTISIQDEKVRCFVVSIFCLEPASGDSSEIFRRSVLKIRVVLDGHNDPAKIQPVDMVKKKHIMNHKQRYLLYHDYTKMVEKKVNQRVSKLSSFAKTKST